MWSQYTHAHMKNNCMPTSIYQQCHFHINQTYTFSSSLWSSSSWWSWSTSPRSPRRRPWTRSTCSGSCLMLNFGCSLLGASHGEQAGARGFNYIILGHIISYYIIIIWYNMIAASHGEQAGTMGFQLYQINCGLAVMAVDVNLSREAWRSIRTWPWIQDQNYVDRVRVGG